MRILVTGITGLFGSYLARELVKIGEVHGLKRKTSNLDLLKDLGQSIIWHEGDIGDYQSLEDIFEGMDLIVHAAGLVSYQPRDRKKLLQVNVEGTTNVVNVMLQKNIKKLIFISSVSALGRNPEFSLVDEDHKWVSSPFNTSYGISKYHAELEVWRGAQEGLQVMIFNPSVLLGKISDKRSSTEIYNYVLQEQKYYPLGDINYLDVRDASKILVKIFQKNIWNERFILSRESISYQTFFEKMALTFKKKPPKIPVTSRMMEIAILWVKAKSLFSSKRLPLTRQTAQLSQQKITFDNSKANALTDFKYTPLESTLEWAMGN
jgi:nucleoside-diphosphate-sugar epimerase